MSEHSDNPELAGHVYDGIQEYDNPTPGWWNWLFFGTAVHSLFYFIYFHTGVSGRDVIAQYEQANAANLRQQFSEIGELKGTRDEVIKYSQDAKWLEVGKVVYQANCISCHGRDGGGLQGPNLTDDHYKNIREIEDLVKVVSEGANNGAMPAWRTRLHPNETVLVACYVASLRGTTPAKPKAPEGNPIAPWPTSGDSSSAESGSSETTPSDVSSAPTTTSESSADDSTSVEAPVTDSSGAEEAPAENQDPVPFTAPASQTPDGGN